MKFEIVKLEEFSGKQASIYTVLLDDKKTLFDDFVEENDEHFSDEIDDLFATLNKIGHRFGAKEYFFKLNEGNFGDGICALFDNPDKLLRLYCIRFGNAAIILGGGDEKPKNIITFQENPKLTTENYLLRKISKIITQAIKDKEIIWSQNDLELIGNLKFEDDE